MSRGVSPIETDGVVPIYPGVVAVINGLLALVGPLAIALNISRLEDEFDVIRTGGDYSAVWAGWVVGIAVWVAGLVRTNGRGSSNLSRRALLWWTLAFSVLQVCVFVAMYLISPREPWS